MAIPQDQPPVLAPHHQAVVNTITGGLGSHMTEPEAESYLNMTPDAMRKSLAQVAKMPEDRAVEVLARMGEGHREWYQKANKSLVSKFGKEAPRFIALLAATSPQKSVKDNMRTASILWKFYKDYSSKLNRPIDQNDILHIIRRATREFKDKGKGFSFTNRSEYNNIIRALDPELDVGDTFNKILAGPESHKIDNFRRNLLGDLMAVTNDTWIAHMLGSPGQEFAGAAGQGYFPFSAKIRRIAAKLGWEPAEVQAGLWQAGRQISIHSNKQGLIGRSKKEVDPNTGESVRVWRKAAPRKVNKLLQGMTQGDITQGASFHNTFEDPVVKAYLGKTDSEPEAQPMASEPIYSNLSLADKRAVGPMARTMANKFVPPHIVNQGAKKGWKHKYAESGQRVQDGSQAPPPMPQAIPGPGNAPGQPISPQANQTPGSAVMASPNVQQGLSFEQASSRSRSGNQSAFKKIMQGMMENLGIKAKTHDAVGDWEGDAENSLYQHIDNPADPQKIEYAAAWYGLLANKQAVLVFHANPKGLDSLYTITFPENNLEMKDVSKVRKLLDKFGIKNRTIIPGKNGITVTYYDKGRADRDKIQQFVGATHGTVSESSGEGQYIGGSTRTGARAAYRKLIDSYESGEQTSGSSSSDIQTKRKALLGDYGSTAASKEHPSSGQYAYSKSGTKIRYAHPLRSWIAPNGEIHPVDDELTHDQFAKKKFGKKIDELLKSRWGRVTKYGKQLFYNNQFATPTSSQKSALTDLALEHGLTDVLHDREDPEAEPITLWSDRDRMAKRGRRVRFSGVQSPQGGVIVRGVFYPGGKYIPKAELEKSNWNQYQEVGKRRNQLEAMKYSAEDFGSEDPEQANQKSLTALELHLKHIQRDRGGRKAGRLPHEVAQGTHKINQKEIEQWEREHGKEYPKHLRLQRCDGSYGQEEKLKYAFGLSTLSKGLGSLMGARQGMKTGGELGAAEAVAPPSSLAGKAIKGIRGFQQAHQQGGKLGVLKHGVDTLNSYLSPSQSPQATPIAPGDLSLAEQAQAKTAPQAIPLQQPITTPIRPPTNTPTNTPTQPGLLSKGLSAAGRGIKSAVRGTNNALSYLGDKLPGWLPDTPGFIKQPTDNEEDLLEGVKPDTTYSNMVHEPGHQEKPPAQQQPGPYEEPPIDPKQLDLEAKRQARVQRRGGSRGTGQELIDKVNAQRPGQKPIKPRVTAPVSPPPPPPPLIRPKNLNKWKNRGMFSKRKDGSYPVCIKYAEEESYQTRSPEDIEKSLRANPHLREVPPVPGSGPEESLGSLLQKGRKRVDSAMRPLKQKPLLPYGGYQAPQYEEEEPEAEPQEHPVAATQERTPEESQGVYGIYMDYRDEHPQLRSLEERQHAGAILADAAINEGPFEVNSSLWKTLNNEVLGHGKPDAPLLPKNLSPVDKVKLWMASMAARYIAYATHYNTWMNKANNINHLVGLYGINYQIGQLRDDPSIPEDVAEQLRFITAELPDLLSIRSGQSIYHRNRAVQILQNLGIKL